jgi:hypothetical protein
LFYLLHFRKAHQNARGGKQYRDDAINCLRTGEIEKAAQRGACDGRHLKARGAQCHSIAKAFDRHESRNNRLRGGHAEGARDAEQNHNGKYRPDNMQPGNRECEQQKRAQHLGRITEREDPATIEAICSVPSNKSQGHKRQKLRQAH